ncbi:EAL domain-containing response regulator [Sideroxydans sp. CL21]|uniref:EAL domain-containing response regulator n=1 Tax=Sideroxydans sp. CL21 TaxID=2600596 RepID=UPI0024BC0B45|nr:EAL domain-containing response regulator [Sideroxydans sp. CL21]
MNDLKMKILVLDDEPFMLKLLEHILADLGYAPVLACDNGQTALELIADSGEPPNLILLDINMPQMDGLAFVRHLVELHFSGSVILVSGEDERMQQAAEKLAIAHKISVLGHLHKPPTPAGLGELIGKWKIQSRHEPRKDRNVYGADEVRAAISGGELVNYYQPKVVTSTGRVMGVETLVRWRHPSDGLVYPDQFIGVAEAHGLIDDLTKVVLKNAFAQSKVWQESGLMLQMSVNLSMDNLAALDFVDMVVGMSTQSGVAPQMMMLEVTETRLMSDIRIPLEILTRLRLKRFRLSIDDFGIGNSSLAQLRDIPFDELKIDQSFVHGACSNEKLWAMFDSCLSLAKQLGLEVVAEGVEDQADWDFVRNRGCDIAQGYFIAKPMPGAELPEWIRTWDQSYAKSRKRIP